MLILWAYRETYESTPHRIVHNTGQEQARAWNFKMWRSGLLDIKLFQLPASVKLEYMGQHKKFFKINYTFYYWKQMYFEQTVLFWINKYDNLSNCKQLTGPVFRGKNLSNSILAEFGINKQLLYNILDQFSDQ